MNGLWFIVAYVAVGIGIVLADDMWAKVHPKEMRSLAEIDAQIHALGFRPPQWNVPEKIVFVALWPFLLLMIGIAMLADATMW